MWAAFIWGTMRLTKSSCFSEQSTLFCLETHRTASRTSHSTQLLTLNPQTPPADAKVSTNTRACSTLPTTHGSTKQAATGNRCLQIPSSQIRRRFLTNWENYSAKFNGLWPPSLPPSCSALPRGSMSLKENQTNDSPGWHILWLGALHKSDTPESDLITSIHTASSKI